MKKGRPTKYKKEYCKAIIDFFNEEPYTVQKGFIKYKNGDEREDGKEVANDIKFFSDFAREIGVNQDTLHEWKKNYPEFSEAFKTAKGLQKRNLVINGLKGLYSPAAFIFTAKNILGWRDRTETELSGGVKLSPIVIKINKNNVPTINLFKKQGEAFLSKKQFILVCCGVQSGKTYLEQLGREIRLINFQTKMD